MRHLFVRNPKDKELLKAVRHIAGYTPRKLKIFRLVTQHSSIAKELPNGFKESNERLEYLGDAVLGAIVADYLFKKYPFKDEGFLTEIRSRIVNRESLNLLARKIGLDKLLEFDNRKTAFSHKSIYGDMLEAFVGAVYLDKGYRFCQKFVLKKLLLPHYDIDEVINNNTNYKSKLIEWAQKENKEVQFEIVKVKNKKHIKEFTAQVLVNDELMGEGHGLNKKKAEQNAAYKTCEKLQIN